MLVLNLHRHWHAEIAEGRKTVEYRVVCPYWRSRLEKLAPGDVIRFRRGYYDRSSDIEATVDGIDFGPCPYPGMGRRLLPHPLPPFKPPQPCPRSNLKADL